VGRFGGVSLRLTEFSCFFAPWRQNFHRSHIHPEQLTRDEQGSSNSEDPKPNLGGMFFSLGAHVMGDVIQFIPKSALERSRLIRQAQAIYESIFPTEKGSGSQQRDF
jgi:hypothetical protein